MIKSLILISLIYSLGVSYEGEVCGAKIDLSKHTTKYMIQEPKNKKTYINKKEMREDGAKLLYLGTCN